MSIWASLDAPDDDHGRNCGIYTPMRDGAGKIVKGCFDLGGTCDCGMVNQPIRYVHSGHYPSVEDGRDGCIDVAMIPPHITKDGKDDGKESHPFLRFGVWGERDGQQVGHTVVLTRGQAVRLQKTLNWWIASTKRKDVAP